MAYLMEICFNNDRRLLRKRYLFEYRGVKFKLVQDNPRKWADHLLAIVPENDPAAQEEAFSAGCEFVSALGWENRGRVAVWEAGGRSWHDSSPLQQAEPSFFTFPRVPFGGNIMGHELRRIPYVETPAQRTALALFREANASNSAYLSFLFFWQVLEVDGCDPERFINKHRREVRAPEVADLPLGSQTLGRYLDDDCRDAIAHIRRRRGRKALDLDRHEERMRLAVSNRVVKAFAEYYIREVLGLKKRLNLIREKRGGFPTFVDDQTMVSGRFRVAYRTFDRRLAAMFGGGRPRER